MKSSSDHFQSLFRFLVNIVLILLQLSIIGLIILQFSEDALYGYWLVEGLAVLVVLNIVYRKKTAAYKISWIIFVLILPAVGIVLYFIWGRHRVPKKFQKRWDIVNQRTFLTIPQNQAVFESIDDKGIKKQVELVHRLGDLPVWNNTKSKYLKLGEEMHRANLQAIKSAERFIFLEYFIVTGGKMYDELMAALYEKAAAGVEIRMMVDEMGSLSTLPKDFYKNCAAHQINSIPYNPLSPSLFKFISFRDHRKMTIVDGRVAITGGINIGDEYINEKVRFGHWKDMAIRLEGEAVFSLTTMFINMWDYSTGEVSQLEDFKATTAPVAANELVMPFCDGPMNPRNPAANIYMKIFANAKDYLYITTPYLILDTDLTNCILLAARSGVDVRIITPGIPDKKLVYATTRAFYGDLLAEGVRIYEYAPGFVHGKVMVTDDQVAIVGSINMDYRSLIWNYECGTWISGSQTVLDIKADLLECIAVSREVCYAEWEKISFVKKVGQAVLRIMAPLM
ncbi:cardiolipin synthase [uncultured Acetobacterium sp.]|uniref:cardiolipin synthase n=1 Tax=uncultured Acetobacterium sp. TaxID=217139 RepID=UPI0025F637EB|nr:cardiolipin synthase [uncultured Acetobacterium sp.]